MSTFGGAIYSSGTIASISNSTFSGNSATTYGGGIFNSGTTPNLSLTNNTFSSNTAGTLGGGVFVNTSGTVTATNNLFANSSLHNLSANATNLVGTHAALGLDPTLRNLGGPTLTHALLPGSAAINAGNAGATTTDQRGLAIYDGIRDIGAFESQGFTVTIASGNDQNTLIGTAFAAPLVVNITANNAVEPVNGGTVTFANPATGASTSATSYTASVINGQASQAVVANPVGGTYNVTAGGKGLASADFSLLNDWPTVSLSTTTTAIAEGETGSFTISRAPSIVNDLTVTLTIAGTSTVTSDDYTFSGANVAVNGSTLTVLIPAGQTAVTLNMTALVEALAEPDETLTLNLATGSTYFVSDTTNTASIRPSMA